MNIRRSITEWTTYHLKGAAPLQIASKRCITSARKTRCKAAATAPIPTASEFSESTSAQAKEDPQFGGLTKVIEV